METIDQPYDFTNIISDTNNLIDNDKTIDKYEKEIDELKTKVMWWAVINRKKLWT